MEDKRRKREAPWIRDVQEVSDGKARITKRNREESKKKANPRWRKVTPQEKGRIKEKEWLKKLDAQQHPMSGAGSIKYDGSDEHNIYEIKTTGKGSFILKAKDLQDSFKYANKQDKTMVWVIEFLEHDLVVYVFPSRTFEI